MKRQPKHARTIPFHVPDLRNEEEEVHLRNSCYNELVEVLILEEDLYNNIIRMILSQEMEYVF